MREIRKTSHGRTNTRCGARRASDISIAFFVSCLSLYAVETNSVQLPSPATEQIVFDRDIQPILESSCLRCHGPEKPRSHFRLDNRASALAGGDDSTNDVVPGQSDRSDLIRYVAGLDKDIHMPPPDKGPSLTLRQIGLLRAWIDQGVNWNTTNQPVQLALVFAPAVQGIGVQGDKSKFRALEDVNDGFSGGMNQFSFFQQTGPNEKFSLSGHIIAPDRDYKLNLAIDETDRGFVHAGFDEWRQYYENNGGFDPAVIPPELNLNQNLYVDNGRFWVDFGLTPPRWPQIVLGYEYDFRKGTKSTLDWGEVGGVNLAPSTKTIDEQTHILKLDLTHDFNDWHLEDNAQVEFYTENNVGTENNVFYQVSPTPNRGATVTSDNYQHVQGMNTLMLEKQLRDWWFLSGGLYYSRLEGSDFFAQTNSPNFVGTDPPSWNSDRITLRRQSEIFSLASIFLPLDCLSFSVGTQNEWTRDEGFGGSIPDFELGTNNSANGDYDEFQAAQNVSLRFTKIPFTVLFAEGRFEEDSISESEQEGSGQLMDNTDATSDRNNLRAGFNTSPWTWFEWNAEYQRQYSDTDYNHLADVFVSSYGDPVVVAPFNGYPAFILNRKIEGDGFATKLTLHPLNWLRTTLSYQYMATDYSSKTDPVYFDISPGGQILDGRDNEQRCGLSTVLTPFRRFYLSGAFTYSHSRVVTAANDVPSVVPYRGDAYTFLASAAYALNSKTSLQATYSFSDVDYGQNNAPNGVPLGMDFTRHELFVSVTRQLTRNVSGALRYQ
ncbi:MAG TPA: c-type cytochrome domain-containing protein, partial [Candidatus Saccharimonadales bacterium]|nr:c-type cytochrome domain-containing protein [Candidatus Saccharimonadales bacterium]